MKTVCVALLAMFTPALQASTIGGDIAAWFSDPNSGFSASFFGNGITIDANVVNSGGGSAQALCTADCDFTGLLHGNEGATATIGQVQSSSFLFDLQETGSSAAFTGTLTLFVPFTNQVIASTDLETFLIGAGVSNGLPEHVETDFQFVGNAGAVPPEGGGMPGGQPLPEPASVLLSFGGVAAMLFISATRRRRCHA